MQWVLWICVLSPAGGQCDIEKRWVTANRAECFEQLSRVSAPNTRVISACVRERVK